MNSLHPFNILLFRAMLALYAILILAYGFETGVGIGLMFQTFLGLGQLIIAVLLLNNFSDFSQKVQIQLYIYYGSVITVLAFVFTETFITEINELAIIPMILATYFVYITKQIKTVTL